jgi:hypothetical protein
METGTAPAALLVGAIFFLLVIWPFWPVFVPPGCRAGVFWRSALELAILFALGAPFAVVAWSVAGQTLHTGGIARAVAGVVVAALGIRLLALVLSASGGRHVMALAMLACVGPVAFHYAAFETMDVAMPRLLEVSPLVSAARLVLEGWQRGDAWRTFADVWLWPAAGILCIVAAILVSLRRWKAAGAGAPCDTP